jgi:DsbC/DsbD-like thiol-disulfide interchange protein
VSSLFKLTRISGKVISLQLPPRTEYAYQTVQEWFQSMERSIGRSFTAIVIALLLFPSTSLRRQAAAATGTEALATNESSITVESGELQARIMLSPARALGGQKVRVAIYFVIAPGWHIYGKPLPEDYTPTTVTFDASFVSRQNLEFPKPMPVKFDLLGETLPVYQGRFRASGEILLREKLEPGEYKLGGTVQFQECNDNLCKMPQQVRFNVPVLIEQPRPSRSG